MPYCSLQYTVGLKDLHLPVEPKRQEQPNEGKGCHVLQCFDRETWT
jgi:hypothetical protein